jgi:hypothetical protein
MHVLISIGTFLAALLASFIGLVLLMPLGLGLHPFLLLPLVLLVAAHLAAHAAGWTGTWLATDGTRTDLPRVVRTMAAMGAVLALFCMMLVALEIYWPVFTTPPYCWPLVRVWRHGAFGPPCSLLAARCA